MFFFFGQNCSRNAASVFRTVIGRTKTGPACVATQRAGGCGGKAAPTATAARWVRATGGHLGSLQVTAASRPTHLTPPLQTPGGVSRAVKSLHPVYSQLGSAHDEAADPKRESPPPGGRRGSPGGRPGLLLLLLLNLFPLLFLHLLLSLHHLFLSIIQLLLLLIFNLVPLILPFLLFLLCLYFSIVCFSFLSFILSSILFYSSSSFFAPKFSGVCLQIRLVHCGRPLSLWLKRRRNKTRRRRKRMKRMLKRREKSAG